MSGTDLTQTATATTAAVWVDAASRCSGEQAALESAAAGDSN
jgi:hypothetical protein